MPLLEVTQPDSLAHRARKPVDSDSADGAKRNAAICSALAALPVSKGERTHQRVRVCSYSVHIPNPYCCIIGASSNTVAIGRH